MTQDTEKHNDHRRSKFHVEGPLSWAIALAVGTCLGLLAAWMIPGQINDLGKPIIPLWLVLPFATLLLSVAVMPFISEHIWHQRFPEFAFSLGGLALGYMLLGFQQPYGEPDSSWTIGSYALTHSMLEYYSFIALVCGIYVVSGGILVRIRGKAGKHITFLNLAILAFGALFANVVGTTGASMLLLRPFMRANEGRLKPIHIVLFIMIVSNCGGCLTPIGDPPLYLGYLKGVPFFWTLTNLWQEGLLVVSLLLVVFFAIDFTLLKREMAIGTFRTPTKDEQPPEGFGIEIRGALSIFCLVLMVLGVFIDPFLKQQFKIVDIPVGATFQLAVATFAYFTADKTIHAANKFSFFPVKEVGLLFLGIFLTMVPALAYLGANGAKFGIDSPTMFYFGTGILSAVLDNAPTYLNFLQIAIGDQPISRETIAVLLEQNPIGVKILSGISTGAVFFGAMTYIGNGPNFMVRSMAQSAGVKMPSFFGYLFLAVGILFPILVINWFIFIR